jgi:hypothetical protein
MRHIAERVRSSGNYVRVALGLAIFLAAWQLRAATVRGQIAHHGGLAARYISVRVVSPNGSASPFGRTGDDGWYYLNNIPAGEYTLEIQAGGDKPLSVRISVREPTTDVQPIVIP